MSKELKVLSTNILANSPHYADIIREYNKLHATNGKVNALKFYREVILPRIPEYKQESWYQFIRRFKDQAGLRYTDKQNKLQVAENKAETDLFMTNQEATSRGINAAINLGSAILNNIRDKYERDPDSLTAGELKIATEALFKAMKSQDSRIHAIGKVREDDREEEKLHRTFNNVAYG